MVSPFSIDTRDTRRSKLGSSIKYELWVGHLRPKLTNTKDNKNQKLGRATRLRNTQKVGRNDQNMKRKVTIGRATIFGPGVPAYAGQAHSSNLSFLRPVSIREPER